MTAALALLAAEPYVNLYDGYVPDGAAMPYVVVYRAVGRVTSERLCGDREREDGDVQVTSVGATAESASIAGTKARGVLTGRLQVPGRNTWRGEHLDSQPIRRDDDIADRVVFYGVDRYRLSSTAG